MLATRLQCVVRILLTWCVYRKDVLASPLAETTCLTFTFVSGVYLPVVRFKDVFSP